MLDDAYAECHLCCAANNPFVLSVSMLSVSMLSVSMLSVIMLGFIMLSLAPLVYRYAVWVTKMLDMHFTHTDYYRAETTKESLLNGKDQYNLPPSTN
jgi:hypothetical protein